MAGAIPVIQILAFAVAIRVGNATGTTLLKGAGEHRMLAFVNLATGVANVVLSVAADQALRPRRRRRRHADPDRVLSAFFILFPAACRRVGLPAQPCCSRTAVLPALWPALVVGARARRHAPHLIRHASGCSAEALGGGVLYLALFFVVPSAGEDRTLYAAKVMELLGRRLASAA